jgi:hypothetical protein
MGGTGADTRRRRTRIRVDRLRRVLPPNTILARIQAEATAE